MLLRPGDGCCFLGTRDPGRHCIAVGTTGEIRERDVEVGGCLRLSDRGCEGGNTVRGCWRLCRTSTLHRRGAATRKGPSAVLMHVGPRLRGSTLKLATVPYIYLPLTPRAAPSRRQAVRRVDACPTAARRCWRLCRTSTHLSLLVAAPLVLHRQDAGTWEREIERRAHGSSIAPQLAREQILGCCAIETPREPHLTLPQPVVSSMDLGRRAAKTGGAGRLVGGFYAVGPTRWAHVLVSVSRRLCRRPRSRGMSCEDVVSMSTGRACMREDIQRGR